jgi:hypothetical protein
MKKRLTIVLAVVAVILIAGFGGKAIIDIIFPQAGGIIAYGEKQQIDAVLKEHAKQIGASDVFAIKTAEADGQKIMYLSQTTIDALIQKKLLTKVNADGNSETVISLPTVSEGKGLLFAKQEADKVYGGESTLPVKYEGNLIVGDGRAYVDVFVVLEDSHWQALQEKEKTMAVMKIKKNAERLMGTFEVETQQLVSVK